MKTADLNELDIHTQCSESSVHCVCMQVLGVKRANTLVRCKDRVNVNAI